MNRHEAIRAAILADCARLWPEEIPCAEEYRWAPWVAPEYRVGHKRPWDAVMFVEGFGPSWEAAVEHARSRGLAFSSLTYPKPERATRAAAYAAATDATT